MVLMNCSWPIYHHGTFQASDIFENDSTDTYFDSSHQLHKLDHRVHNPTSCEQFDEKIPEKSNLKCKNSYYVKLQAKFVSII